MRDYRKTLKRTRGFEEKRLFDAGVKAFQRAAIQAFRRVGSGEMNGHTAAEAMRALKVEFRTAGCIGADPFCPCQDGDACHYVAVGDTPAMVPRGTYCP